METYSRMVPRGLAAGTAVLLVLAWGLYALDPEAWPGLTGAIAQTVLYLGNVVLTARNRRLKVTIVGAAQRYALNPLFRTLHAVGLNPLGLAVLETRGRSSGRPRRVPVGNGRAGDDFWIVAEHGLQAQYVRNILADPHVRIRVRVGLRHRWLDGVATVRPDDDPLARQRRICRGHPLRALNAATVRVLGADLVTVHVRLGVPVTASASASVLEPAA